MWPKLRGSSNRYINETSDWLVPFITDELPYYDFPETERFYRIAEAMMVGDTGRALLACNDRFYLLTQLLGRKDAFKPWLYERCREVEADPDDYLDLWAREHYKSTIITYAGVIQEVLADPEMTVGIFSVTKDISKAFVSQIKTEFDGNDRLKEVFADVLWQSPRKEKAPHWSDTKLTVRRQTNPKEASIEAHGLVNGMPTGRHFRLRVYDDLVTERSCTNPEMTGKTTEMWQLSDNLGGGEQRRWHIGTRYSFADTYGWIFEKGILKPRVYAATDNGRPDGNPVFMSREVWEKKKLTQESTLAAQMLQNPLAGKEQVFNPAWLRSASARPKTINVYIMGDPSKGKNAKSDRTAIAVVGIDTAGNRYLLDGYRHRMMMSERWEALKGLYKKWSVAPGVQTINVGWERYGQQTDDEYFQEKMRDEGPSFELKELAWVQEGPQSKKHRVERLQPDFKQGRFYLPALIRAGGKDCQWHMDLEKGHMRSRPLEGPTNEMQALEKGGEAYRILKPIVRLDEDRKPYDLTAALIEEMEYFPFAPKDDLVDALSRLYDMEPIPPSVHELPSAIAALEAVNHHDT
jgi:hypothetical protein